MDIDRASTSGAPDPKARATRRQLLIGAGLATTVAGLPGLGVIPVAATPAAMQEAIEKVTRGARLTPGRVKLEIPPLVENGNTVPCTVSVESPMTAADHVKAIHVLNERNPQPNVVSCRIGARAGLATIATRIRLNHTQTIVAIAEMSDGSFWTASASVVVTVGACLEDLI